VTWALTVAVVAPKITECPQRFWKYPIVHEPYCSKPTTSYVYPLATRRVRGRPVRRDQVDPVCGCAEGVIDR
jgi:hypothetical protein